MIATQTRQLERWRRGFGDDYTKRNQVDWLTRHVDHLTGVLGA